MLSIITPVYNGEQFIESCIKAVIDQNCPNVEHIIVDGGSTDRTVEIIKQYVNIYPHIRWISEKDKGQSDAMNKGILMAKNQIVSFLNVDDYYEPNVLNRVLKIFPNLPVPSILVGNCNIWDAPNKLAVVCKPAKFRLSNLLQGLNEKNYPTNPSAYFYHTCLHQQVGMYKIDEHYAMDLDFLLRAVQVAKVKYINETWGNWMRTENTKTGKLWQSYERGSQILDNILRYYRKDLPPLQRQLVAIRYELGVLWDRKWQWTIKYYFKQYIKNPQNIPLKFRSKLMKLFSIP
jgi:glycosyltransferase involved in cell wall biosynthesis